MDALKRGPAGRREERSSLSALAGDSWLALGGSLVAGVLGFVLAVIVTRGLGAGSAGAFFEAVALATILANGLELGADTGLVRSISQLRAEGRWRDIDAVIRTALVPVVLASATAGLILFVLAPEVGELVSRGRPAEAGAYLRAMAPFVPAGVLMLVCLAAVRGSGAMRPYVAVAHLLVPGLRPLLVGAAIGLGLGAVAIGLAWSLPLALGAAIAYGSLSARRSRARALAGSEPPTPGIGRGFWRFTAPRGLAAFLQIVVIWVDVLLVGALRSSAEAGVYGAASRTLLVGTVAMQAIALAAAPLVGSALAREDHEGLRSLYRIGAWWLVALSWPFYLALAVFAPLVLGVFGPGFRVGTSALVLLCAGILVQVGTGNNKVVLLMAGHSGWNLTITAVSLVVNVSLNLLWIPRYGISGAAAAWVVTFVVDNGLTTLIVYRTLGIDPFGRGYAIAVGGSMVCFGVLGLAARALLGATLVGAVALAAVAVPLYVLLLWRFRDTLHLDVLLGAARRRAAPGEADRSAETWAAS